MDTYEQTAYDLHQLMHERAVSKIAMRIKHILAEQWAPLSEAGWSDDDIRVILQQATEQCAKRDE